MTSQPKEKWWEKELSAKFCEDCELDKEHEVSKCGFTGHEWLIGFISRIEDQERAAGERHQLIFDMEGHNDLIEMQKSAIKAEGYREGIEKSIKEIDEAHDAWDSGYDEKTSQPVLLRKASDALRALLPNQEQ